jgi:micrococcal nuclease
VARVAALALATQLALASVQAAEIVLREFTARATGALGGDTIVVAGDGGGTIEVRLADIGAPQGSAYYAPEARTLLQSIVEGKNVLIAVTGEPGPGRLFGRVHLGELDVNLELVRRGAAWVCWEYAADTSFAPWESDAKRWRRGLWAKTWEIEARTACDRRPPGGKRISGS